MTKGSGEGVAVCAGLGVPAGPLASSRRGVTGNRNLAFGSTRAKARRQIETPITKRREVP